MPKINLAHNVLALSCRYFEYETLIDIVLLGGDKKTAHRILHSSAIKQVTARTCKSATLLSRVFGYFPTYPHMTRLIIDCPQAYIPILPAWTLTLPPSLVDIRFHFKQSVEVFLRPLDMEKDDVFMKHICSSNGWTSASMKTRFPSLKLLHLVDSETSRRSTWNDPMKARFMAELPETLTSLHLDGVFSASEHYPMLPPPDVIRHLVHFSMPIEKASFGDLLSSACSAESSESIHNLLTGSKLQTITSAVSSARSSPEPTTNKLVVSSNSSSNSEPSPASTPGSCRPRSSQQQARGVVDEDMLSPFLGLRSLELDGLKYDTSASYFKYLTNLDSLSLDFDFKERDLNQVPGQIEPPSSLANFKVSVSLSDVPALLSVLPAHLVSLTLHVVKDSNSELGISDLPASLEKLKISSANAKLSSLFGLPANCLTSLDLSINFARGFVPSVSGLTRLNTLVLTADDRPDIGDDTFRLPSTSLTYLSTGDNRPLSVPELAYLPSSIRTLEGYFTIGKELLNSSLKTWDNEEALRQVKSHYLGHLTGLRDLQLKTKVDQSFVDALSPLHSLQSIDWPNGAVGTAAAGRNEHIAILPKSLTHLSGIALSRPIDTRELPKGLIELDASTWKWAPPLFCGDHHSNSSSPKTSSPHSHSSHHTPHLLSNMVSFLTHSHDSKPILPESNLPNTLTSLTIENLTKHTPDKKQPDYACPFYLPLLSTAPMLQKLCIIIGQSGHTSDMISILPRSLTDLTIVFRDQSLQPSLIPANLAATAFPPQLQHLRISHGPLRLHSVKPLLPHLFTLHVEELIIDGLDVVPLPAETTRIDSGALRRLCRFTIVPPHTHLRHDVMYTVEWTKMALKTLPHGLQVAVFKTFLAQEWPAARRDFGLWLPSTLTKLNIGHWEPVHPKSTQFLPRGLTELLINASELDADSFRALPSPLLALSLFNVAEFGPNEASELPQNLESLTLCSRSYKAGTFILLPQKLLRATFGDTEEEISETQLKHLPKSLLRLELGFPEGHRVETTFEVRLKAVAKMLTTTLPSLAYFGYTRDPAGNLLTVH